MLPQSFNRRANKVQHALAFVVLVAGIVAVFLKRSLFADVSGELRSLRVTAVALLVGLVCVHRCLNAFLHRCATPGVSFGRMLIAAESYSGASHSFAGGAGIGTALRIGMYRSWGVDGLGITTALVASSVFPSFAMWILGGAYTLPLVFAGDANRNEMAVAFASIAFVAGPILFWSFLLHHGSSVRIAQGLLGRVSRKLCRLRSRRLRDLGQRGTSHASRNLDPVRLRAQTLVRSNGFLLFCSALAAQVTLSLVFVASAWALAPEVQLPILTLIRTFAMLRVMSSFVPVPGGIGIVDVGLVTVLETAGLSSATAIATVALYRALTFVLPLISGPICAFHWWRKDGRNQVVYPDTAPDRHLDLVREPVAA